jgi:hypothetical protein
MARSSLLDRYLQFTANFLPMRQREDIIAELRANLQEKISDREESLGRPLTEDEEAALLKEHGHPMAVAARYLPVQRLVGGPWLALYWLVLRVSLAVAAVVLIVRIVVGAALLQISGDAILTAALQFPASALMIFAWTTLAFVALDYFSRQYARLDKSSWDPRKLPNLQISIQQPKVKPLTHLAGSIIGLAVIIGLRNWQTFLPLELRSVLQFTPAWHVVYQFLLIASLVGVIAAFVVVLRPDWYGLHSLGELISSVLVFFALKFLLNASPWVSLIDPARDGAQYSHNLLSVNLTIYWCIAGTMMAFVIAIAVHAWRCAMIWRKRGITISATPHAC